MLGLGAAAGSGPNPAFESAPLNFEQIAAVAPDLVLNVQSSGDAREYHAQPARPTIEL
ncbi:MAG: hypothetical protein QOD82_372, partial [Pseudonocardiales bacterium]|nr:hypothetical protein [Pseudonocardiales bacterium]